MERYVIDSYEWIEYFKGTAQGRNAREYVESGDTITPSISVMEFARRLLRDIETGLETRRGMQEKLNYIKSTSTITELTYDQYIKSAEIDLEMKKKIKNWGMADSIVLTTARELKAKVVTGDEHFRGLKDAIMIK